MIESEQAGGYRIIGGRPGCGLVLLCDHASNTLPEDYGTLGLRASEFERHIAYDIGAAAITERLAAILDAPAVLSRVSRLLIDPNRGEDDPTLIMRLSDGAVIPGNHNLSATERTQRIERYYRPYHQAVSRVISTCRSTNRPPVIFSVHSMTHAWKGVHRPWQVSILSGPDRRLAEVLLSGFRTDARLLVGDNVPYQGSLEGDTLYQHAMPHGLLNAVIEYRQDLVADAQGQAQWAETTAAILQTILQRYQVAHPFSTPEIVMTKPAPDPKTQLELEAAAYRRLVAHLQTRADVQNIDLMNLAGFCRNCLANWYQDAATAKGLEISKEAAREQVYGMPYKEWQAKHQKDATPQQKAAFDASNPHKH